MKKNVPVCNFRTHFLRYYSVRSQETINEILLRYRGLLFAVCNRYARRGVEVDDLLQESMLALWERKETMMGISPPPKQAAWIWRVARNRCVDILRRSEEQEPLPETYDPVEEDITHHAALHELIGQLPEPDRTIVTLHLEGYEYKEIGKRTGMTKTNVGVRLMRIKEKLKEQWNK